MVICADLRYFSQSMPRSLAAVIFWATLLTSVAPAQSPRFIIDDDEYVEQITLAGAKLVAKGKLLALDSLRRQVHTRPCNLKPASPSYQKLEPPALYDHLRASTLTLGTLYKCRDCGDWHFNGSAGFVVGENGVVCTCCHVVMAQDDDVKEGYLLAADAEAHVFPVQSVLAADTDSDTCFVKVDAPALKPLPLRAGIRPGERVYCLSHPGGYYFMFTQGMVARLNRRPNDVVDEHGKTNGLLTRPILFLNITAEFAPGSSGAPVVDEAGNVVAQVASIADAGEPAGDEQNSPASPSVPVRFCTATEEILRLTQPGLASQPAVRSPKPKIAAPGPNKNPKTHKSANSTN